MWVPLLTWSSLDTSNGNKRGASEIFCQTIILHNKIMGVFTLDVRAILHRRLQCRRWTDKHTFTGGSNAGGGRINTPSPEAAMPEVDEKNKPTG